MKRKGKEYEWMAGTINPIPVDFSELQKGGNLIYGKPGKGISMYDRITQAAGKDKADDLYFRMLNGEDVENEINQILRSSVPDKAKVISLPKEGNSH